jgi:2-polyprenyl-3-methyl-5-hydroxy-6-metoxy-1,4-benzoquinol methylase
MTWKNELRTRSRDVAKRTAWPLRRLLDPRFAETNSRLQYASRVALEEERVTRSAVEARIDQYSVAQEESLLFVGSELQSVREQIDEIRHDALDRFDALARERGVLIGDLAYGRRIDRLVGQPVEDLDADSARLLNHAESHLGFAAQRGLWLNPAVSVEHRAGDVVPSDVNERIVEIPYAMRALGGLRPPAAILDVGSAESLLALHCASLGYRTCALDLRPYPFQHPNLDVVVSRLEDWEAGERRFDAILCVSTLEHVGLGWYGEPRQDAGADRRALQQLGGLLTDDGFVVLTVPYGAAAVDAVQRTYDRSSLETLLEGWVVTDRQIVAQTDRRTWIPHEDDGAPTGRAVAVVTARPSGTP